MNKISVIVPVSDRVSGYSPELNLWLKQKWPASWQFILVFDNQILLNKCKSNLIHNNTKLILDEKCKSPGSKRNLGMQHCEGEFLAFFDDDDFIDQVELELVLMDLENCGADIAFCDFYVSYLRDTKLRLTTTHQKLTISLAQFPSVWRCVFRSKSICDAKFGDSLMGEELQFWRDYLIKPREYIKSNRIFYTYNRKNLDSLSAREDRLYWNYANLVSIVEWQRGELNKEFINIWTLRLLIAVVYHLTFSQYSFIKLKKLTSKGGINIILWNSLKSIGLRKIGIMSLILLRNVYIERLLHNCMYSWKRFRQSE